jgi:hypothetical protein
MDTAEVGEGCGICWHLSSSGLLASFQSLRLRMHTCMFLLDRIEFVILVASLMPLSVLFVLSWQSLVVSNSGAGKRETRLFARYAVIAT